MRPGPEVLVEVRTRAAHIADQGRSLSCRYDVGKWRHIQKDEVFGPVLKNRSNVDLKDKWRNLNMDSSGSRRDGRASGDRVCFLHLQS